MVIVAMRVLTADHRCCRSLDSRGGTGIEAGLIGSWQRGLAPPQSSCGADDRRDAKPDVPALGGSAFSLMQYMFEMANRAAPR